MPRPSRLIEECMKYEPVGEPLTDRHDEFMAECLATTRSALGTAKKGKGKFTKHHMYDVFNGNANGGGEPGIKRAERFRGRVHFKVLEIVEDTRAMRNNLIRKALGYYDEAIDGKKKRFKKAPELGFKASHDVLFGTGTLVTQTNVHLQDDNAPPPGKRMSREQLEDKVKKAMTRKAIRDKQRPNATRYGTGKAKRPKKKGKGKKGA